MCRWLKWLLMIWLLIWLLMMMMIMILLMMIIILLMMMILDCYPQWDVPMILDCYPTFDDDDDDSLLWLNNMTVDMTVDRSYEWCLAVGTVDMLGIWRFFTWKSHPMSWSIGQLQVRTQDLKTSAGDILNDYCWRCLLFFADLWLELHSLSYMISDSSSWMLSKATLFIFLKSHLCWRNAHVWLLKHTYTIFIV